MVVAYLNDVAEKIHGFKVGVNKEPNGDGLSL